MVMGRYNYTNALAVLTEWATKNGIEKISFDHWDISEIDWNKNSVKIEGKYPVELKVYLFLHELGHHQLRKNWAKFKKVLPITAYAEHIHILKNDGKYKRRVTYTVSCMEEEFKAWDEGAKLAERLGIRLNIKKWGDLKSKCLISYMRYYATKQN